MRIEALMRRATAPAAVALTVLALVLAMVAGRDESGPQALQIGKPAPRLIAQSLDGGPPFDSSQLAGRPWMLNVWASWCEPCLQEHPYLMMLAGQQIPIVGLNYRDDPAAAAAWLDERGNPYLAVGIDANGQIGDAWQVAGVPMSFLIDEHGILSRRFTGAIDSDAKARSIVLWLN